MPAPGEQQQKKLQILPVDFLEMSRWEQNGGLEGSLV